MNFADLVYHNGQRIRARLSDDGLIRHVEGILKFIPGAETSLMIGDEEIIAQCIVSIYYTHCRNCAKPLANAVHEGHSQVFCNADCMRHCRNVIRK